MATVDELIQQDRAKTTPKSDVKTLSVDDLIEKDKLNQQMSASELGGKILKGGIKAVETVGSFFDRFAGAPTRAGLQAGIKSEPQTFGETFTKDPALVSVGAFLKQFGRDPKKAPTGKEITTDLGVSSKPFKEIIPGQSGGFLSKISPASVTGLGVDVGADISNIFPLGMLGKLGIRGTKTALGLGAKVGAKGTDILTGTQVATDLLKGTEQAGEALTGGLKGTFGAKQIPEFTESVEIARKAGIPVEDLPKAVEFGKGSVLSRAERALAEGPSGESILSKFETGHSKLESSIESQIKGFAEPLDETTAGAFIGAKFDEGIDNFFDGMNLTHNEIIATQPGLRVNEKAWDELLTKMRGIELKAQRNIKRGITKTQQGQGEQIQNAIANLMEGNGSYKQTVESLRDIGEVAFKNKSSLADVPPDIKQLRDMYFTIDKALIKTVEQDIAPEAANALKRFNKAASDLFTEKNVVSTILGNPNVGADKMFRSLTSDTRKIETLQKILSPEDMRTVKSSYLQSLITPDAEGAFSAKRLGNTMRSNRVKNVLNKMFGEGELAEINDFIKLTDRFGDAVLSMSGTGASNAFLDFFKNTLARTGEAFISAPIQRRASQPVEGISKLFPSLTSPTAFLKSPESRLKGAQVLSVQQQDPKTQAIERRLNGGN